MTIPCFAWDGLNSRPQKGDKREHPFSIIAFGIGGKTHDFKQPPDLHGKKPLLLIVDVPRTFTYNDVPRKMLPPE
jgi:hypothetical protein